MGLRERLAAKSPRRAVVPVDLGPVSDDQAADVAGMQAEMLRAVKAGDTDAVADLQTRIEQAQSQHIAEVGFTAVPPDVWEQVVAKFPSPEGVDSGMDWKSALPFVAAVCADDEELQDDEWWTQQLESGNWTAGERLTLWQALLHINTSTPNAYVPKG